MCAPSTSRRSSAFRSAASVAVALAALAAGCGVERAVAVERIDVPADAGGADASIDAAGAETADDEAPTPETGADGDAPSSCDHPVVTLSPGGNWGNQGYIVFNNVYDSTAAPGPQTLYACSYRSWYVVSEQPGDAGAVGSYPNVQMNFSHVPVGSLHVLTSTFAEASPHVGVYEDAYDVWLNGIATAGSTQILIWVDNYGRVPAGSQVTTTTLGGRTYDVWKTDDSHIVLVSTVTFTSGAVDLLEIVDWTIHQGWLDASSTLEQIDFGVEIESTGGARATYAFDDFSITAM